VGCQGVLWVLTGSLGVLQGYLLKSVRSACVSACVRVRVAASMVVFRDVSLCVCARAHLCVCAGVCVFSPLHRQSIFAHVCACVRKCVERLCACLGAVWDLRWHGEDRRY
jgi:hypothetical protein